MNTLRYYKIIKNGHVVDVGSSFLKWNERWGQPYYCGVDDAQFVQGLDGNTLYRASWMREPPTEAAVNYIEADIEFTDPAEYEYTLELLNEGEEVVVPEPEPEPEPKPELEPEPEEPEALMTISQMRQTIENMTATVDMLTDCILEISEILYGGEEEI